MDQEDRSKIEAHYKAMLDKHVEGPIAVDWNTPDVQILNFLELIGISDNLDGSSILEVGTGLGEFYGFLKSQGLKVDFTGVDILPEYIEKTKAKYPEANFLVKDILSETMDRTYDYVFASGALTVLVKEHEKFVRNMIKRMYELATKGVAFNLLSNYSYSQSPEYQRDQIRYYADPFSIFAFCKTITPRVVLNHDWYYSSFSIYLYKNYSRAISALKKLKSEEKDQEQQQQRIINCHLNLGLYGPLYEYLKTLPENAKAEDTMGVCLFQIGNFEQAISHFKKAQSLDTKSTSAFLNLGNTLFRQEKYQEACEEYEKALAIDPKNESCLEMLTLAQLARSDFDDAEKTISKIQNPALQQYLKGELLTTKNQISSAITEYQKVLDLNPNYADAYIAIGCLLEKKGKFDQAIDAFINAQKLIPDSYVTKTHLASCYLQLGLPEQALAWAEYVHDTAESCNLRGLIYLQLGKKEESKKEFEKSRSLDPKYLEAWINLGGLEFDSGNYDLAKTCYEKALELSKTEKEAILGLARCSIAKKDTEKCMELLKEAPASADTEVVWGELAQIQEKYEEAKTYYEKAIRKNRDFLLAYVRLGEVCQILNEKDQAREAYRRVLKINPQLEDIKQRLKEL